MKSRRTRVRAGESGPQAEEHHQPVDQGQPVSGQSRRQPAAARPARLGMGARVVQPEANRLGEVSTEQGLSELTGQKAWPGPALRCDQESVTWLYFRH